MCFGGECPERGSTKKELVEKWDRGSAQEVEIINHYNSEVPFQQRKRTSTYRSTTSNTIRIETAQKSSNGRLPEKGSETNVAELSATADFIK